MKTLIIICFIIILLFAVAFFVYNLLQAASPEALKVFFGHDDTENTEYTDSPKNE